VAEWYILDAICALTLNTSVLASLESPRVVVSSVTVQRQISHLATARWLSGVVVWTLDLQLSVEGSIPGHDTAGLFLR